MFSFAFAVTLTLREQLTSGITVALSQWGAALIGAQVTDTGEPYQHWQFSQERTFLQVMK